MAICLPSMGKEAHGILYKLFTTEIISDRQVSMTTKVWQVSHSVGDYNVVLLWLIL